MGIKCLEEAEVGKPAGSDVTFREGFKGEKQCSMVIGSFKPAATLQ